MMRYWAEIWQRQFWRFGLGLAFGISGAILGGSDRALAQITPDSSLGTESSRVIPNVVIKGLPSDQIDGGAIRGANLFHSFQQFNIGEGRGSYFTNPAGIENILSRVTGSSRSDVLGTLGVLGNANLFLINPNGILFGRSASLDIGGSFVGTTASAVGFGNQGFFSASTPNTPTLLTVNPSAFLFNQLAAASIKNNSIESAGQTPSGFNLYGLRVLDGRSLLFVGGDVTLDGGQLNALGGRVELGGLRDSGTIGLTIDGKNLSLNFPSGVARGDVLLTNKAVINVIAANGGNIAVNAQKIDILRESSIIAGIDLGLGSPISKAGDIDVHATGAITISDLSVVSSGFAGGIGSNGNIRITGETVNITNGGTVNASTFGQGDAGSVSIQASDTITLSGVGGAGTNSGSSRIFTAVASLLGFTGTGNGGDISLQARSIILADGAQIGTNNIFGQGRAGNIQVTASDSVDISGGAALQTGTAGRGDAGSLTIQSGNIVSLDGVSTTGHRSGISSSVNTLLGIVGSGNGGDITINTRILSVTNGAQVSADTSEKSQGRGGNLTVSASDLVKLTGTSADGYYRSALGVQTQGSGDAGNLTIHTRRLIVQNGAGAIASTFDKGQGGTLSVKASELVELTGTSADGYYRSALGAEAQGSGDARDLTIDTRQLIIRDGAIVSAASILGEGRAGKLTVNASESVELIGNTADGQLPSALSTETQGGDKSAGDLTINTGRLRIRDGALVTARTFGAGKGGTLIINADDVELIGAAPDGEWISSLTTETQGSGIAGNLRITTEQLTVRDGAQVAVNSVGLNSGKAGDLNVIANSILLNNQGKLIAQTESGNGGNITLNLQDLLLMRHNSEISTTAGTANQGGNGGSIAINSPFIVAVPKENSDITANAYTGRGGNINITTQGIYGLQFRLRRTPLSDITASSDFGVNGTVQINSAFDVTQGVTNLPVELVDASNQIDQTCSPSRAEVREKNRFVITGRGGLPPNPNEPLRGESVITNWVTLESQEEQQSQNTTSVARDRVTSVLKTPALVEAQGWIYGSQGEVILTAQAPSVTPHSFSLTPSASCNLSSSELSSK